MNTGAREGASAPFTVRPMRLAPDYTDAELDALHAALRLPSPDAFSLLLAIGGMGLALVTALALEAHGTVRPQDGLAVVALMGLYWAGFGAAMLGRVWHRRRWRAYHRACLRGELFGLAIHIGPAGLAARQDQRSVILRWSVSGLWVEERAGLLLVHGGAGIVLGLPRRLLPEGQADAIFHRTAGLDDEEDWGSAVGP